MPVKYDLYRTPMSEDKKNKVRYHARPVTFRTVDTDEIADQISQRCTLTPTDVVAVLDALSHVAGRYLRDGERVHLDGLGYFHISLSCEELRSLKEKRVPKVKFKSITFRADKKFRLEVRGLSVERSKFKRHSRQLSAIEMDALLTDYFAEHVSITKAAFAGLCGFTPITAFRHIKRLVEEKKLRNDGHSTHPLYVPIPGNYRISVNRDK